MKKRQFLVLGLVALLLVLITGLTGCDSDPSYKYEITYHNQTSFTIQMDETRGDWNPRSFKIKPYSDYKIGSNTNSEYSYSWKTIDKGNGKKVGLNNSTKTFYEY